jgi:hypothetical protein
VPIGLLLDAVGGTSAEAWTSAEALRPLKDFDFPLGVLARLTADGFAQLTTVELCGNKGHQQGTSFSTTHPDPVTQALSWPRLSSAVNLLAIRKPRQPSISVAVLPSVPLRRTAE